MFEYYPEVNKQDIKMVPPIFMIMTQRKDDGLLKTIPSLETDKIPTQRWLLLLASLLIRATFTAIILVPFCSVLFCSVLLFNFALDHSKLTMAIYHMPAEAVVNLLKLFLNHICFPPTKLLQ